MTRNHRLISGLGEQYFSTSVFSYTSPPPAEPAAAPFGLKSFAAMGLRRPDRRPGFPTPGALYMPGVVVYST